MILLLDGTDFVSHGTINQVLQKTTPGCTRLYLKCNISIFQPFFAKQYVFCVNSNSVFAEKVRHVHLRGDMKQSGIPQS